MIILLAAFTVIDRSFLGNKAIADREDALQRGRNALELITRQLRSQVCVQQSPALMPITSGGDNTMTFFTYMGDPSAATSAQRDPTTNQPFPEQHTITYASNKITETDAKVTSISPLVVASPYKTTTLATNVILPSGKLFQYFAGGVVRQQHRIEHAAHHARSPPPTSRTWSRCRSRSRCCRAASRSPTRATGRRRPSRTTCSGARSTPRTRQDSHATAVEQDLSEGGARLHDDHRDRRDARGHAAGRGGVRRIGRRHHGHAARPVLQAGVRRGRGRGRLLPRAPQPEHQLLVQLLHVADPVARHGVQHSLEPGDPELGGPLRDRAAEGAELQRGLLVHGQRLGDRPVHRSARDPLDRLLPRRQAHRDRHVQARGLPQLSLVHQLRDPGPARSRHLLQLRRVPPRRSRQQLWRPAVHQRGPDQRPRAYQRRVLRLRHSHVRPCRQERQRRGHRPGRLPAMRRARARRSTARPRGAPRTCRCQPRTRP